MNPHHGTFNLGVTYPTQNKDFLSGYEASNEPIQMFLLRFILLVR